MSSAVVEDLVTSQRRRADVQVFFVTPTKKSKIGEHNDVTVPSLATREALHMVHDRLALSASKDAMENPHYGSKIKESRLVAGVQMGVIKTVARIAGFEHTGQELRTYLSRTYDQGRKGTPTSETKPQSKIVDNAIRKSFSGEASKMNPCTAKIGYVVLRTLNQHYEIPEKKNIGTPGTLQDIGQAVLIVMGDNVVQGRETFRTVEL
jgi:hypothetical protein